MGEGMRRTIVVAARPRGEPVAGDFRLEERALPDLREGEVLLRTRWISIDPYQRGRMDAGESYAPGVALGEALPAGLVSEVVASRHPDWTGGETVVHYGTWADHTVSGGAGLRRLDPAEAPVQTALGVLGMTGLTGWAGLSRIGQPKAGETLVVGAAAGPVGSMVGQIAKARGCRVVGIAGGEEKCRYVREELGFDAALDHSAPDLAGRLAEACPEGVDIYWENIGGEVLRAVLPLMNRFGRVPLCGFVAHYNDRSLPEGPDRSLLLWGAILSKRLRVQGFIVDDYAEDAGPFHREVAPWIRAGTIRWREDVVEGLERAPEQLVAVLKGRTFGKALVHLP
jgi:NADPH-dependent curcumin reductase CurA